MRLTMSSSAAQRFYRGQRALVTGGSMGIGLALARGLADAGAHLTLVARQVAPLEAAQAELRARAPGVEVATLALDVGDEARVRAALAEELAARPIDILVNNAGVSRPGRFLETDPDEFHRHMRVNFHGPVALVRAVAPHLVARGRGTIVNVSSVAGVMGVYGYTAYASSKFALQGFSECLRGELAPHGVQVSVVMPPETDTPMLAGEQAFLPAETKAIAGTIRTMSADDVARATLEGVARGDFEITPGAATTWTVRMARMFPAVQRAYCDWRAGTVRRGAITRA